MAKFRFSEWLWDWLFSLDRFRFEWDPGNETKSARKHAVTCGEAEEVFTGGGFIPLGEQYDPLAEEPRYALLGETGGGRLLFVAFTIRDQKIRVVSARPMNGREKKFYVSLRQK